MERERESHKSRLRCGLKSALETTRPSSSKSNVVESVSHVALVVVVVAVQFVFAESAPLLFGISPDGFSPWSGVMSSSFLNHRKKTLFWIRGELQ